MIAWEKYQNVKELLARGTMSHRKIAEASGVSRNTVCSIAHEHNKQYRERRHEEILLGIRKLNGNRSGSYVDYTIPLPTGVCPTCGKIGFLPCVVCGARAEDSREKRAARSMGDGGRNGNYSLQLDLPEETMERVKVLRERKRRLGTFWPQPKHHGVS